LHATVQVPLAHVAVALATLVVHALAALQVPPDWHDSTPLPLHVVCPGAQTPAHAPPAHVWLLQLVTALHVPADWHVSYPLPEHCAVPGTHTPVHVPPTHADATHAVALLQLPSLWQASTPLPLHLL
jgi:hypothetical protein